jgi:transposase
VIAHNLYPFYAWCAQANIAEIISLATTVEPWWSAILAFIDTGVTNAPQTPGGNSNLKNAARLT